MTYNHRSRIIGLALLAASLLAASCGKEGPADVPEDEGRVSVEFVIGAPQTKSVFANESAVDHWAVFVFSASGALQTYGQSASAAGITKSLVPGTTYHIYAAVNAPSGFNPAAVTTEGQLLATVSSLGDNSSALVMFGGGTNYSFQGGPRTEPIPVTRLACKLGVRQVTVNMTDPYYASQIGRAHV